MEIMREWAKKKKGRQAEIKIKRKKGKVQVWIHVMGMGEDVRYMQSDPWYVEEVTKFKLKKKNTRPERVEKEKENKSEVRERNLQVGGVRRAKSQKYEN